MNQNSESNIRFRDLFSLFVSNLWIMILVAVVVGGSIFTYNFLKYEPVYKSTGSIYILRHATEDDGRDYNSNFSLALSVVNDCTQLLKSRSVLEKVIEDNSLNCSYEYLKSVVTIKNAPNTRHLEISAITKDPEQSKIIVDSVCEIGKVQIEEVMGFDQVNIVDKATLATRPANTKYSYTKPLIGALAAFLLTFVIIALIFIFDEKITDPELVEKHLGVSVLAVIPNIEKEKKSGNDTDIKRHRYYVKN